MFSYLSRFSYLIIFYMLVLAGQGFASEEEAYRFTESGISKILHKDFEGAIRDLKEARRYQPANDIIRQNLALAYHNYGFNYLEQGETRQAIEQFEHALFYEPESAYTMYNLGQAYYSLQDVSQALHYLEEAMGREPDLDGLASFYKKVKHERQLESDFDRLETMHFIIAAAPEVDLAMFSYIKTYLEDAYGTIGAFLDHYPQEKVIVLLYSEERYQQLLQNKPHWSLALFDGKVRIPVARFQYTNEDVIKILYHEYTHAVLHDMAGSFGPLWLNEGIASKAEDLIGTIDRGQYRVFIERYGFIPVWDIPADFSQINNTEYAMLAYSEAYLLVDFIIRRVGRSGLRSMVMGCAQGVPLGAVFQQVMNESMKSFQKKWEGYLRSEYTITKLEYR